LTGDGSSGDSIYNGKFNDEKSGLKVRQEHLGRQMCMNMFSLLGKLLLHIAHLFMSR